MKKLIPCLAVLAVLIIIFGTIYGVAQQVQRSDANYPQIQLAEDAASALNQGTKPAAVIGPKVDFGSSLAPFVIVYDRSGKVVTGSGYLAGAIPTIPIGVLRAADGKSYHTVSWQPQNGVRIAVISVSANNYYVLSGRSLKEVEVNENRTFQIALFGGSASVFVLGAAYILGRKR